MATSDPYGYGDATPDVSSYGYGDASPDTNAYGYGDASPDSNPYGYGDSNTYEYGDANPYGYGDANPPAEGHARRERPRRRCSVTKYSLDAQDEVKATDAATEKAPSDSEMSVDTSGVPLPSSSSDTPSKKDGKKSMWRRMSKR